MIGKMIKKFRYMFTRTYGEVHFSFATSSLASYIQSKGISYKHLELDLKKEQRNHAMIRLLNGNFWSYRCLDEIQISDSTHSPVIKFVQNKSDNSIDVKLIQGRFFGEKNEIVLFTFPFGSFYEMVDDGDGPMPLFFGLRSYQRKVETWKKDLERFKESGNHFRIYEESSEATVNFNGFLNVTCLTLIRNFIS